MYATNADRLTSTEDDVVVVQAEVETDQPKS